MKDLPEALRTYWSFQDELLIENGGNLKGKKVLIPKSMRHNILQQLHSGLFGHEKTKLLAKDTAYWHNINKDIDRIVDRDGEIQPQQIEKWKKNCSLSIPH